MTADFRGVSSTPLYIIVRNAAGDEVRRIGFNAKAQLVGIMPMENHLLPGYWFDYSECQAAVDDIEDYEKRLADEAGRKKKKRGK